MTGKQRVLMVDDEPNVLTGYKRSLGRKYDVTIAEGAASALRIMSEEKPFPVVFTDMRMPGMDGIEFLLAAKQKHKDTVYVMLTGNADQQTAIDAINRGQIFRFLNKPCPAETMALTIESAFRQYELVVAERVLLRDTLTGSVKLLVEAVALSDPHLGDMISAIRRDTALVAKELGISTEWRLPLAASLGMLGGLVIPDMDDENTLSDDYLKACAEAGANLLRHIPKLEEVAQIIAQQRETGPMPEHFEQGQLESRVVACARVLRYVVDLHREVIAVGGDRQIALQRLRDKAGFYDARLNEAGARVLAGDTGQGQRRIIRKRVSMEIRAMKPDMILDQDVVAVNDKLLLAGGYTLTPVMIERLRGFEKAGLIQAGELWVLVEEVLPESDARLSA